jgi:hypothetical protein
MDYQRVLHAVTARYVKALGSTFEINNGSCEEWAEEVRRRLVKSIHRVEVWSTPYFFAATTHTFVRIDGRFYDAECLEGVLDHNDLPIFKRLVEAGRGRQPVWLEDCNYPEPPEGLRDVSPQLRSQIRAEQIRSGVHPTRALV